MDKDSAGALQIADDVVLREEDRLCFKRTTGAVFILNDVGYASVLSFERPSDVPTVATAIASLWRVDPHRVETDLSALVHELLSHGIIRQVEQQP